MGKKTKKGDRSKVSASRAATREDAGSSDGLREPSDEQNSRERTGVSRRQMLKLAAGAVVGAPLASKVMSAAATVRTSSGAGPGAKTVAGAAAPPVRAAADGPQFFTKEQYAMLDELTEMIIPTDDHSPGARAAKVAEYIDSRLAEEFEEKVKQDWRDGIKAVDDLSQELNQKPFMESTADQRHAVMTKMVSGANTPDFPAGKFFGELKGWTAFGYYSTKIGIHQEMEYKGNVPQREFSGYDVT